MGKRTKKINSDRPIGALKVMDDALPSPRELAKAFETKKVTIDIEQDTLEFFKREAGRSGAKYQRLIREVLKKYASRFKDAS